MLITHCVMDPIDTTSSGRDNARQTQNRTLITRNSGFPSSLGTCGSRAIPHFGHEEGLSDTTSGCMGQMYLFAPETETCFCSFFVVYAAGSALNFATQCLEQKWYVVPLNST